MDRPKQPSWMNDRNYRYLSLYNQKRLLKLQADNYTCSHCGTTEKYLVIYQDKLLCKRCLSFEVRPQLRRLRPEIVRLAKMLSGKVLERGVISEIALHLEISRERVRQILKQEGFIMPYSDKKKVV